MRHFKQTVVVFSATAFNFLFAFLLHFVLGRLLGPSDYGDFGVIINIAWITGIPLGAVGVSLVKYVSVFNAKKQEEKLSADQQTVPIFSWFVTDPEGLQLARGPEAAATGINFAYRTYFHNGWCDRDKSFRARPRDRIRRLR